MNKFVQATQQTTLTENGAFAYNTAAQGALFDMFSVVGALRTRSEEEIVAKFKNAFAEDALLATKLLFYAGNIRGGLGERRTFQICLNWLAQNHPEIAVKNIINVPHFNRWDILIKAMVDTPCEGSMWKAISEQLEKDCFNFINKRPISLLAKWMPSINASSAETKKLAKKAMNHLGARNEKEYRKVLHQLREYLKVVENQMSHGEWGEINYEGVPSYAMKRYAKAFEKQDKERFVKYISQVEKGEKKINASVLYPYNLIEQYTEDYWSRYYNPENLNSVVEAQWKALPSYMPEGTNAIVMADVSGSMVGRPMATSIGLATYFAQHNHGDFKNLYMTFTDKPNFINISDCKSLYECIIKVMNTDIGYSTNLYAAFKRILQMAIAFNIPQEDMPEALIVISDMEIDSYFQGRGLNFVEIVKKEFEEAHYTLPKLVMWNVQARKDTFLTQSEDVILISGQSPSQFKYLTNCLNKTAYEMMLEVLNDPMYDRIKV